MEKLIWVKIADGTEWEEFFEDSSYVSVRNKLTGEIEHYSDCLFTRYFERKP